MQMYPSEYRIDHPKKALRKSLFLAIALALVVGLVAVIYYFTKVNRAATDESHEVSFTVEKGLNTKEIAEKLLADEVIHNKFIFLIYSQLHGVGGKIQAGEYQLNSNMTIPEIIDVLTRGKVVSDNRTVTIVEGRSNNQIGKLLYDRQIANSADEFEDVLNDQEFDFKFKTLAEEFKYQGFMFPDTYTLAKNEPVKDLVSKMLNNFESKVTDKMIADAGKTNYDFGDILIVASIIEKEVGRNKTNLAEEDLETMQRERELVASVFYNRLEVGMALESDATVNYVTGKSDRSVTIEDTKIDSRYNTYRYAGLPPTPISNPGIDSIIAAIYPAESDYLFFLNSPDGKAYFAKTLAEHGENRSKYLR
jgi:UPF0755 protein